MAAVITFLACTAVEMRRVSSTGEAGLNSKCSMRNRKGLAVTGR